MVLRSNATRLVVALVAFTYLPPATFAQPIPFVVQDLFRSTTPMQASSDPETGVAVGGLYYFSAKDAVNGRELWVTDGTAAGTRLVLDINPGSGDSGPTSFFSLNGAAFFIADDGVHGRELWRSNGTTSGTQMVIDLRAGPLGGSLSDFTILGGQVVFRASLGVGPASLWSSTGTAGGTTQIKFLGACCFADGACSFVHGLDCTAAGGTPSDVASTCAHANCPQPAVRCCRSDLFCYYTPVAQCSAAGGTPGAPGDACVPDPCGYIPPDTACCFGFGPTFTSCSVMSVADCQTAGGQPAGVGVGCTPNPCDGLAGRCCLANGSCTLTQTREACDELSGTWGSQTPCVCSAPWPRCCLPDRTCGSFSPAECIALGGRPLSTGVTCATVDVCPDPSPSAQFLNPHYLKAAGGKVHFICSGGGPAVDGLWTTNGTTVGTQRVTGLPAFPNALFTLGNLVIFALSDPATGLELWSSDGTAAGTNLIADINPGPASGVLLGQFGEDTPLAIGPNLYFFADDGVTGVQIWRTDGTTAGTARVTNLAPDSDPRSLRAAGSSLVFTVRNPGASTRSVWSAGASPGAEVLSGGTLSGTTSFVDHLSVGGLVYFSASSPSSGFELWTTNGQPGGTSQVYAGATALDPGDFGALGSLVLFAGQDSSVQRELWRSNGTAPGTMLVKDIATGVTTHNLAPGAGSSLFFAANAETSDVPPQFLGAELWITDGTQAGLLKDINPGSASSLPSQFVDVNGTMYFTATSPGNTQTLWKSDGTATGTVPVGELVNNVTPGFSVNRLTQVGGFTYFQASTPSTGLELWRTDGTEAGTNLCFELGAGAAGGFDPNLNDEMINFNGELFFSSRDGLYRSDGTLAGSTLLLPRGGAQYAARWMVATTTFVLFVGPNNAVWRTDGSVAGTIPLTTAGSPPFGVDRVASVGPLAYFVAYGTPGQLNKELFVSDGTVAGTQLLADIEPGSGSSFPEFLTPCNGVMYFLATTSAGSTRLYRTDGTAANTTAIFPTAGFNTPLGQLCAFGNRLVVATGPTASNRRDLVSVDATGSDAVVLTPSAQGRVIAALIPTPNSVYFTRREGSNVHSLWRSDGTPSGEIEVYRNSGLAGNPVLNTSTFNGGPNPRWAMLGDSLYFVASASTLGSELFRTNDTGAGVTLVVDLFSGPTSSEPSNVAAFYGALLFNAQTPLSGPQLFMSDGTGVGTGILRLINGNVRSPQATNLVKAGNSLFYTVSGGSILHRTTGTAQSITVLKDFTGAPLTGGIDLNGNFLFAGFAPPTGTELCQSDGTPSGTVILKDLNANGGSQPRNFAKVGSRAFFAADIVGGQNGELCVTDGTPSGTSVVLDGWAGPSGSLPREITDLNGVAIFAAEDGTAGLELWRSDGTANGTTRLKDIYPGLTGSSPSGLVRVGNYVLFSADNGTHGRELWRTDGTASGTQMLRDIALGSVGSAPAQMLSAGARAWFTAYTPETGVELWTTDGTATGTMMLFEIAPGPSSASVGKLTLAGSRLYFLATRLGQGTSLWSYDWPQASLHLCPADFNRSGSSTVQDLFDFLIGWFSRVSLADFNGSGAITVQDLFDFLSAWFSPCP